MISFALLFVFLCVIIGSNIGIVCVWVVINSSLCKSLGHNMCQVIEDLNHVHAHGNLHVVGNIIFNFEILKLLTSLSWISTCFSFNNKFVALI